MKEIVENALFCMLVKRESSAAIDGWIRYKELKFYLDNCRKNQSLKSLKPKTCEKFRLMLFVLCGVKGSLAKIKRWLERPASARSPSS